MGSEYDGKIPHVVLAHVRKVQAGTRWIQCTRSTDKRPEIKNALTDLTKMTGKDSLTAKCQGESDEKITGGNSSAPTNYEPDSDSCAPHSRWLYAG